MSIVLKNILNDRNRLILKLYKYIKLKKINLSDVNKNYLKWVNDESLTRFTSIKKKISKDQLKEYVVLNNKAKHVYLRKILYKSKHIGNLRISKLFGTSATIGILIGEKKFHNKGIGTCSIRKGSVIAKKKGFKKIFIFLNKKNSQSIKIFKKNNFSICIKKPKNINLKNNEILLIKKFSKKLNDKKFI